MPQIPKTATIWLLAALLLAAAACAAPSAKPEELAERTIEPAEPTVPEPGPNLQYIGPQLWGLVHRHAGGQPVPEQVEAEIITDSTIPAETSLEEQIEDAGGSHVGGDIWVVPVSELAAVMQRDDVALAVLARGETGADGSPIYNRMNPAMAEVVQSFRAGVPAEQAALRVLFAQDGKVGVTLTAPDADTLTRLERWLDENGIYVAPQAGDARAQQHMIPAWLPVEKAEPLAVAFPAVEIEARSLKGQGVALGRSTWPAEFRAFEQKMIEYFSTGVLPYTREFPDGPPSDPYWWR